MSCHGCANKFSFFNKEEYESQLPMLHDCPNCGFSFCSKCLKLKTTIPKFGNSVCKVCRSCYAALTERDKNGKTSEEEYCPPESFLKRLESLENPSRPPITIYLKDQRMQQLKVGLSDVDCEIVERLEKLREERKRQPVPTEEEVVKRLAVLKGEDPVRMVSLVADTKKYVPPDTLTSQEKADNLLHQYFQEHELDSRQPDAVDEIAQRLAKLRGQDTSSGPPCTGEKKILNESAIVDTKGSLDSMSENDVNDLIVQTERDMRRNIHQMKDLEKDTKHYLRATKIELSAQTPTEEAESSDEEIEKTIQKALDVEKELEEDSEDNEMEEEIPWCIICNENATIRCIDCDNDLYCKSCYTQGHDEWKLQHHRNVPFTPKE